MRTLYYSPRRLRRSSRMYDGVYIPVNVSADDDNFVISAYVPGIAAEDLKIEVLEDSVSVEGEFVADEDDKMRILRAEQPVGEFYRSIRLGSQLDAGKAQAEVKDGILTLSVPKAETAKTRKIAVKAK